jgi:predicted DsbA family dithiol-disulfide isomerase
MTMRLPLIQPRSRRAHEAAKWAQTQDQFDAYNASVFRAFFERGEDISDIDVLVNLARDLGLDHSSLRAALESKQFEPSVIADERESAELGVHAVPAFVFNRRFALTGVQTVTALEQMLIRVREAESR